MLPAAKILLSDDGLHGWAFSELSNDHLGADLIEQEPQGQLENPDIDRVLSIKRLSDNGPADRAGIKKNNWIVGLDGKVMSARNMLRQIAKTQPGQQLQLRLKLRHGYKDVTVTMGKESMLSRTLKLVVQHVSEPANRKDSFTIFVGLLVVVLIITLVRGIFTFIQEYLVGTAIWLGIMDLRCENYNKVLHLPTTFFFSESVSDATSRFVQDTNELARGQNTLLGKTMVEPAKAVGCAGRWRCAVSWQLTLLAMLAGPAGVLDDPPARQEDAQGRPQVRWRAGRSMLAVLDETLQGIRVVKAYTMEGAERRRFFRVNRQLLKQQNKMERLDAATGPAVEALGIVGRHGGRRRRRVHGLLHEPGMEPDDVLFLTWMVALFAMFDPVRKLAKVTMRFQRVRRRRQANLRAAGPRRGAARRQAPPTLPRHSKSIEFRNVSFRYPSATTDAVENVNLTIQAGQTVAIVGPNGSGKTTLVSLVPRLLDPTGGAGAHRRPGHLQGLACGRCGGRSAW